MNFFSNKKLLIVFLLIANQTTLKAQKTIQQLDSVLITSSRITLPFKENSRTITVITQQEIQQSAASNVADLLQQVAGVDIRRRGTDGMQSDIYIRGGHFNQTLILIDGFKTENPQTGHHTMNVFPSLENIERIEIIKGPAARIFGQNAFLGAINIVTKKHAKDHVQLSVEAGSYAHAKVGIATSKRFKKSQHQIAFSQVKSDGYRHNTDFKNQNYFLKSSFDTKQQPITVLASFTQRKFGAENFYTNTPSFHEYEETQTSLIGVSTQLKKNNLTIKPSIYWKRGQDQFLLKRSNPSFSRNFNITNKIGAAINTSYTSSLGITGFGIDGASITLASNNLGNQNRIMTNAFLEHRFVLANNKLDITPGVSLHYFSDFNAQLLPGLDVGYKINDTFKIYGNIGYSYRVPTYTELYINIPSFLSGNNSLQPEKALAEEIGFQYAKKSFNLNAVLFNRKATDLIDYVKATSTSTMYLAQNLREINSQGFEINSTYSFKINEQRQSLKLGYTFIEDDYKNTNVFASRYLLNTSIKHHVTANAAFTIGALQPSVSYSYIERPTNSYNLVNAKLTVKLKQLNIFGLVNNVFNTNYIEANSVPMPKGNFLFGLAYKIQ